MNSGSKIIQHLVAKWLLRKTAPSGVRRVASLAAAVGSDVGIVRQENQDRAAILRGFDDMGQEFAVLAVADGIGSMREGAACAALTIGSFFDAIYECALSAAGSSSAEWLNMAAHCANNAVLSSFRATGGSTLVAVVLRKEMNPCWLSIGDSRVYALRERDAVQLSTDDTIAGQLGKGLEAGREQSKLLQFVGMDGELDPHVEELRETLPSSILLTTDGVHFLSRSSTWFTQVIQNAGDPGTCAKRLIDLARWCGGPDNASIVGVALPCFAEPEMPAFRCLEIWDAFGELQLPVQNGANLATLARVVDPRSYSGQGASPVGEPEMHKPVKPLKASRKAPAKSRKISGAAERKQKMIKPDVESSELFVDFPKNSE